MNHKALNKCFFYFDNGCGVNGDLKYIAPVKVYAGEFKMEALAGGALRVLTGKEEPKIYTGIPVWNGLKGPTVECF